MKEPQSYLVSSHPFIADEEGNCHYCNQSEKNHVADEVMER